VKRGIGGGWEREEEVADGEVEGAGQGEELVGGELLDPVDLPGGALEGREAGPGQLGADVRRELLGG
jgi:hypothetical protein